MSDEEDYGHRAQQAAERRIEQLEAALAADEDPLFDDADDDVSWPEDMTAPYCGCMTCVVREVLHAAYPLLALGIERDRSNAR